MISEQEQALVRLLSDDELYTQAVDFMRGVGKPLPSTQINGLLNVSLGNTYKILKKFVDKQIARKTWSAKDQYIPDFYRRIKHKLTQLEQYALTIKNGSQAPVSPADKQDIEMALAREFIQHVLAENDYRKATGGFDTARDHEPARNQNRPYDRGRTTR